MNYRSFSQLMRKRAATVMTPEAEQAAMQPPMDPAMAGGAPMPPGGAPMDPAMAGGPMPPGGAPMDPAMAGGAPMPPQGGGQVPPEIIQDQAFMQFLMQMGVQFYPNSGSFIGPDGQPVPADIIVQAYQQFQQMMAQQGGMPPQGGAPAGPEGGMPPAGPAPADPAMAGAPMPQGGAPMDPAMDPAMAGAPADPMAAGGQAIPDDIMNQISSAVMSGVESVLQDFSQQVGKVLADLNDKLDKLSGDISALSDTDDRRTAEDKSAEDSLRAELSADLNPVVPVEEAPVKEASMKEAVKPAQNRKLNIFDLINGR